MTKRTQLCIGSVTSLLASLLLLVGIASAQGSSIYGQVIEPAPPAGTGGPAAFAAVRICPFSGGGLPCSPTSAVFADPTLTTPVANPYTTDQLGNYSVFVATGTYIVQITAVAGVTYSYLVQANGSATVSSVGLSLPGSVFLISGSPVTTSGTLTGSFITQLANTVFAAPSGSAGTPSFRTITPLDIPWGTPGCIGCITPNVGDFTTVAIGGGTPLTSSNQTGTGNIVLATAPTLAAKRLNNVRYCDQFAGATADVQINAAIADLPSGGGTIDCRGYGATTQILAAPILVGSSSKQVAMIIDRSTQFNITATGGVDAVQVWEESSLEALDSGNVIPVGNFVVQDTANINNVVASYPRAGPSITNITGITIVGDVVATVTGAMLDLVGVTDKSTIQNVIAYNFNGPGLRIQNAAGGVPVGPLNITNVSINGVGIAGARPVQINCVLGGGVIAGVNFFGGSLTHPGTGGLPILDIQGNGAANCIDGVSLYGTQFESFNASDIGINIVDGLGVSGSGLTFTAAFSPGASCIKIAQTAGVSYNINFDNVTNFNSWTSTLVDTINSVTLTDPRITHYTFLPPLPFIHTADVYGENGLIYGADQNYLRIAQGLRFAETTDTAQAGADICNGNTSSHALKCSYNNDAPKTMARIIASGASTLGSGAIGGTTCNAAVTTTAVGTLTTDSIQWAYASAPSGTTDGKLTLNPYVDVDNVHFVLCNPTAGSLTPTGLVVNWKVIR